MTSMEQINGEIATLEQETPTHAVMQKLSSLYIVRDHMTLGTNPEPATVVSDMVDYPGTTDFAQLINNHKQRDAWAVMDDLMNTLQVLNPRLYDAVLQKLK